MHIALTANDRLVVNGRTIAEYGIHEDRMPQPWGDSANGARIAMTSRYILIETFRTDCIDFASSRIFVLDRDGALRATSRVWSVHDAWSGFSEDRGGALTYSSEGYCDHLERPSPDRAYVFVLHPDARAFVREERAHADVCEARPHGVLPMGSIYFAPMRPISPQP